MRSHLFWDQFADISVNRLVNPGKGEPFLIVADPKNDLNLAEALLAAGLRSGANTTLIIKDWYEEGTVSDPGPIVNNAVLNSKYVLTLCGGMVRAPAMQEAAQERHAPSIPRWWKASRTIASPRWSTLIWTRCSRTRI